MIDKVCDYRGHIFIKQNESSFIFYPTSFKKQFAILYDLSFNENEEASLSLNLERGCKNVTFLKLTKQDYLFNKEEILQFFVDGDYFTITLNNDGGTMIDSTLQVLGGYGLKSIGGIVEALFTSNDGTTLCLMTSKYIKVYEAYKWLCGIWPPKSKCVEYCITVNEVIVGEFQTFSDFDFSETVTLQAAEKCYLIPITEDDVPVTVPWNEKCSKIKQHLSAILKVPKERLQLLDKFGKPVAEEYPLKIRHFRDRGSINVPSLYYDVISGKVRCISMTNKEDILEIMTFEEASVFEIKRRIEFKMKMDEKRLIICRDKYLLFDTEIVKANEELNYCTGLLRENIEFKKVIGQGGFGRVYKCVEKSTMSTFALKDFLLPPSEIAKGIIIPELLVMTTLVPHPNIVRYLGIYVNECDISIAMEYMPKGSLSAYIKKHGPLNEASIQRFSMDILKGLNYLHNNKIFHRDIKADNVLLGEDSIAKLCDFGVSKILTDFKDTELFKEFTQTAECGTYRWMAPEVIKGERYGLSADIWSFGATVIHMITGNVPYYGFDEIQALFRIAETKTIVFDYPNPRSKQLEEFVECCIRPIPSERLTGASLMNLPFFNNL